MKHLDSSHFLDDTFRSLNNRFKNHDEFMAYYNSLESDEIRGKFLRIGTSYLFFVKNGNWRVDVPRSNPEVEYFNNSYKLIGIIGLIESLSSEKFMDFHTWLVMKKNKVEFPITNKDILTAHYQEYKKEHGSIKKCLGFFENLSEQTKKEIYKLIKIGDKDIDNIKIFVEMLYAARSEFAHESSITLEIGDWFHYGQHNGNKVFWRKFKLKYLLDIFEEGIILHFNKYSNIRLHNKAFKADSRRLAV
jgi:hypothetical protein